jgi:SAM-dependent methyltransferase
VTDPDVLRFVTASLPPPPARVLEVGAGRGDLANELRSLGYDVLAIDPATDTPDVVRVAIADVEEPAGSFDAAVAVLSLHHVEPLAESLARLAELVRPGGRLVVDEFDIERFDERAARWQMERRDHEHTVEPTATVANLRAHLHSLRLLRDELGRWFALGAVERGPYLYRWELPLAMRAVEEAGIDRSELPVTGARFVGTKLTDQDLDI